MLDKFNKLLYSYNIDSLKERENRLCFARKGGGNMKKLTIILALALFLCLALTLTAFAQDTEEINIASQASGFLKEPEGAWNVVPKYLVDGDRETGTSATHSARYTKMAVLFNEEHIFSRLVVVTNGKGTIGFTGNTHNEYTDFGYWFTVRLYNANGDKVFQSSYQTYNHENENREVIVDLSENLKGVNKIELEMDSQWHNEYNFWELEAYEHKCKYDSIKIRYMTETCIENGNGIYACKCGAEKHDIIPAIGYHDVDRENPQIFYKEGLLCSGEGRNCCRYCDEFYESFEISPVFDFLGYSASYSNGAICLGFAINDRELEAYEKTNSVSLKYGAIISTAKTDKYIDKNANVIAPRTIRKEAQNVDTTRFDITLNASNWNEIADYDLVMCAYVIEGDNIYYLDGEKSMESVPATITYNKITKKYNEETPIS